MNLSNFLFVLLLISILLLFSAPAAESTFILMACLLNSPLCPFRSTTT
ncbi:uncharacterized protein LOC115624946 [Scaptodrosophila lebanonensis]|uniref:Uncharacterized protein LOC115624946 n=1 Tax=Drosophila lebanonensis TaxID=7225 RepID=A0A6J2TKW6_DROLE|nr:uncharacterized protein LOC115624946 [Scaptodrosophila lebanonensis]